MPNTNEQIVYSRAIALKLRQQGFEIIRIEKNPYNPKYDCYVFRRSSWFDLALSSIITERQQEG